MSFSGLLSFIEEAAKGLLAKQEATPADLCFSLQVMDAPWVSEEGHLAPLRDNMPACSVGVHTDEGHVAPLLTLCQLAQWVSILTKAIQHHSMTTCRHASKSSSLGWLW